MIFFRKNRHFASRRITKIRIKKYSIANEFKKQRTKSVKYTISATRFKIFKFWRAIAAFSFIFIITAGLIAFMFFSTFFSVQDIGLIRQDFRADMETISKVTEPFRNKNIFLVSKSEIKSVIRENFSEIQNIEIEKKLPRRIIITVSTYPVVAKMTFFVKPKVDPLSEAEKSEELRQYSIFINQVGNMSNGTTEDEGVFLIEQQEVLEQSYKLGENVISKELLSQIERNRNLLEETIEVGIVSAKYFKDAKEIHFIAGNGTAFWVDFATSQESQIRKMEHIIAETNILKEKIEYFDLRINERIFYKPLE